MNLDEAKDRYYHDPEFAQLVAYMENIIRNLDYSPTELRNAAMFAHLRVLETNIRPNIMYTQDSDIDFDQLAIAMNSNPNPTRKP